MLVTYEIEARRAGEPLPKITLASSRGIPGVLEQYINRYGRATEVRVKVLAEGDGKIAAAQARQDGA